MTTSSRSKVHLVDRGPRLNFMSIETDAQGVLDFFSTLRGVVAMAMALVGYVSSMMVALAVLVVLLNSLIDHSSFKMARPQPHLRPPIAQPATPEQSARAENKAGGGAPSVAMTTNALTTNPPSALTTDRPSALTTNPSSTEDSKAARKRKALRVETKKNAPARLAELQRRKLIAHQHEEMGYPSALGYQQETTYDSWRLPSAGPRY